MGPCVGSFPCLCVYVSYVRIIFNYISLDQLIAGTIWSTVQLCVLSVQFVRDLETSSCKYTNTFSAVYLCILSMQV